MRFLPRFRSGLMALFRRRAAEEELEDELRQFVEASIDAKVASGMSRHAAERAARLELGSAAAVKDWTRDVGWEARLANVWQDVRYAVRLIRRSPGFALAAGVSITVGTGAAIAMYSVLYGILLRPLPVSDERSLAVLYAVDKIRRDAPVSYPRLLAWRDGGVFADLAGVTSTSFDLVSDGVVERTAAHGVTGNFFPVVGISPFRGRLLAERDAQSGEEMVPAVVSHALWTRRFGADEDIVGRTLTAGTRTLTVVGVAPPRFERWRGDAHLWVPMESVTTPRELQSHGYSLFTPIGRVRPDVDAGLAHDRLVSLDRRYSTVNGLAERGSVLSDVRIVPLRADVVPSTLAMGAYVLLIGVGLTWFVVCANVANLLLGRGARRASELAVRLALGAHRARLMRQLLVEGFVLAVPAGIAGLVLAYWGVHLLVAFGPPGVIGNDGVRVDLPVVLLATVLIVVTALGCGAAPAIRLSRASIRSELNVRAAPTRFSTLLLSVQFAVAVIVLIGATLLAKSVWRMNRDDLGFQSESVLAVRFQFLQPAPSAGSDPEWTLAAQQAILERLGSLPGVDSVTVSDTNFRPAYDMRWSVSLDDGRRLLNGDPNERPFTPRPHTIGPDYFRVHGVPLLEGREFTERDDGGAARVVVINRAMAEMLWPGQSPLGRRLNFGRWSPREGFDEPWHEIVGVAADMRYGGADEPLVPEVYRSAGQAPLRSAGFAILKTRVPPETLAGSVREQLTRVDSRIAVHPPRTLDDLVAESTALTRYNSALLGICALITAVLSAFGVYSLLAYAIASMRRELGIRIALGAAPRRLTWDVLAPALAALIPGAGAGLALGAIFVPAMASELFEVAPRDPLVFAGAALTVILVGLASAWIAARHAARIDPLIALRAE